MSDPLLLNSDGMLLDGQSHLNASTRGLWQFYARHRGEVERLILPDKPDPRLAVLGAGNCNDLDLVWAHNRFAAIHLFDLDRAAMERALQRQGVANHSRIHLHGPIDLTAVADLAGTWKGRNVPAARIEEALRRLDAPDDPILSPLSESFDLVLSPCVLSQLFLSVRDVLGASHPDWPRLKDALRRRHLRQMTRLLAPGGRGVLVIDVASTSDLPQLDRAKEHEIDALMHAATVDGKCFKGLRPAEMLAAIRSDPQLARRLAQPRVTRPWIWHLGFTRAFLVYGLTWNSPSRAP